MAKFVCTRGDFGGGLFVPETLPTVDYADLCEKSYAERADVILGAFFGSDVKCGDAYSQFDDDPATVVKPDDNLFVAELWHGPTRSAADIPQCVLPELTRLTGGVSDNNCDTVTIAALTVCFYSAYCELVHSGEIDGGDVVDFVVPDEDFKFVLAGWYARRMGLPINRLVCACKTDGALLDFLDTGVYDIGAYGQTPTAALTDNIERFIFDVGGGNAELTCERMAELKSHGRFSLTIDEIENVRDIIAADYVDGEIAEQAIADLFDEYGYVADPDTAIAYAAAAEREFVRPTVVLSTKDPFLSAATVMRALGQKNVPPDKLIDKMEELTAMECAEVIRIKN